MRRLLCIPALLLSAAAFPALAQDTTTTPEAPQAVVDTAQQIQAARDAGQQWLDLVDAADYEQSWTAAAQMLKDQVDQAQWAQLGQQVQSQVGALQSRTLASEQYTTSLPNLPEGQYVVLVYSSEFAQAEAREMLVLTREEGGWKVAGYRVLPPQQQQ